MLRYTLLATLAAADSSCSFLAMEDAPMDKTVVKPDGSTTTKDGQGRITTIDADGSKTTAEADGTTTTEYADGKKSTRTPDNTVTTENPDGSKSTKHGLTGKITTKHANGQIVTSDGLTTDTNTATATKVQENDPTQLAPGTNDSVITKKHNPTKPRSAEHEKLLQDLAKNMDDHTARTDAHRDTLADTANKLGQTKSALQNTSAELQALKNDVNQAVTSKENSDKAKSAVTPVSHIDPSEANTTTTPLPPSADPKDVELDRLRKQNAQKDAEISQHKANLDKANTEKDAADAAKKTAMNQKDAADKHFQEEKSAHEKAEQDKAKAEQDKKNADVKASAADSAKTIAMNAMKKMGA